MTVKAVLLVTLSSLWFAPALAQSTVGGPDKKPHYVGGATAQKNLVVPNHAGSSPPTLARGAVGGPKPHDVGATTTQKNPVVPSHHESSPPLVAKPKTEG
jgi:hypothetical protein